MTTRSEIVETARSCLGTPFRHQGRLPGRGLDCLGLVIYTLNKVGLLDFDYTTYPMHPPADLMTQTMRKHLNVLPVEEAQPGDIYRFSVGGEAIHVGIATSVGVIHAVASARGVVEHRLDSAWRSRIVEAYRVPGVN